MSSHFACIGLPLANAEELQTLLERIADRLVEEARQGDERHLRWTDGSGASLAVHVVRGSVDCVTPYFPPADGLCRWTVASSAAHDDVECAHCGGADLDVLVGGELVTRSTVQWLHYRPYRGWLGSTRSYQLEVAAFGERVTVFADEPAFAAGTHLESGGLKLAPNAFMPVGMFTEGTGIERAATATMAGKIVRADLLENTLGGRFWRLRLETLPGRIDVVTGADAVPFGVTVGGIALVDAWLVGRPLEPVPKVGWLRRILARGA